MVKKPDMFKEAEMLRTPKNPFIQIIIFIAVFLVIALAESLVSAFVVAPELKNYLAEKGVVPGDSGYFDAVSKFQMTDKAMIASLFATVFGTLISIFHCRCIECRPISSMGTRKKKAIPNYFIGILVGFVMMSAITLIQLLLGAVDIAKFSFDLNYKIYLLYLLGFLIQGMSEEFIFRGYLMNTIGAVSGAPAAIAVSSFAFSLAHIFNQGISVLAIINLVLFGVFASIWMLVTDNIWGVCGIHSMWNFSQGNIYGISVSGTGTGESIIKADMNENLWFINGGDFGIEGGLVTTVVLLAGIAAVLLYHKKRQSKTVENA